MATPDLRDEQLDRLLGARPDLGVSERERVESQVLERTAQFDRAEAPQRGWRWLTKVGGLVALATALLVVLVARRGADADGDLTARGGPLLKPSLGASCLVDGVKAPCVKGAKLVFQLDARGYRGFAAVVETPTGETLWVAPRAGQTHGLDTRTLEPTGLVADAMVLDGPPGVYVIHAVFSPAVLTQDEARAILEEPSRSATAFVARHEVVVR